MPVNPGATDRFGNYTEEDNPLWDHAFIVSIRAPTHEQSLRLLKDLEKALNAVLDFTPVSAVIDTYEEDNDGQRVLYLHSIEDPGPPTGLHTQDQDAVEDEEA